MCDGSSLDELRLTFYVKERHLDDNRVEVSLFGCIQIVVDRAQHAPIINGDLLLRPRYNNLTGKSFRYPMSGKYPVDSHGDRAYLLRNFYTAVKANDPMAIAQLPAEETPDEITRLRNILAEISSNTDDPEIRRLANRGL